MSTRTNRLLKWSMVAACVAAVVSLSAAVKVADLRRTEADRKAGGYRIGDRFEHSEIIAPDSNTTLVVWLEPRCGACVASAKFFGELAGRSEPGRTAVSFVAPGSLEMLRAFLRDQVIPTSRVFAVADEQKGRRFGIVPSFVLVDRAGTVLKAWTGKRNAAEEQELIDIVSLGEK